MKGNYKSSVILFNSFSSFSSYVPYVGTIADSRSVTIYLFILLKKKKKSCLFVVLVD